MSLLELIVQSDDCLQWLRGVDLSRFAWHDLRPGYDQGLRMQIRTRLISLLTAAPDVAGEPPVSAGEVEQATLGSTSKAVGVATAISLVKRLLEWATRLLKQETETSKPAPSSNAGAAELAAQLGLSLDALAVADYIAHPDWTKKRIAEHLGCNEKSLAPQRCPKLAAAIAANMAAIDPGRRRLHGSKDADGNLEAWEEE